jgi:shikimate kinase
MPDRIVLIGMMGAGKTSVGTELARLLGWDYWDNDAELQRETGRDARTLVAELGVEPAHAEETRVLVEALRTRDRVVVAAAGSVVADAAGVAALRHEWVAWLRAPVETLAQRVRGGSHRPFLESEIALTLQQLDAERRGIYEQLATVVVDVDTITPRRAAELIAERWDSRSNLDS